MSVGCHAGSAQQPEDRSVPRWRLRCKQEAELESLSKKLADLSTSMLDNVNIPNLGSLLSTAAVP